MFVHQYKLADASKRKPSLYFAAMRRPKKVQLALSTFRTELKKPSFVIFLCKRNARKMCKRIHTFFEKLYYYQPHNLQRFIQIDLSTLPKKINKRHVRPSLSSCYYILKYTNIIKLFAKKFVNEFQCRRLIRRRKYR